MILNEVKEAYVKELLSRGKRADGRGLLDYREVSVDKNVFENCEGSAIAHFGETKVLAGIKIDVGEPFPDRPNEGIFSVNAEFAPLAHPEFSAGPPDERSIELARIVDRGIRAAGTLDLNKLVLPDGKVIGVFVDLFVLDHSGNLIDAAGLAAMSALKNTSIPKYEPSKNEGKKGTFIRDEKEGKLHLNNEVYTFSFEKLGGKLLLDASEDEEIASEGRFTIAMCDEKYMVAAQKSGAAGFTPKETMEIFDISASKFKELAAKA